MQIFGQLGWAELCVAVATLPGVPEPVLLKGAWAMYMSWSRRSPAGQPSPSLQTGAPEKGREQPQLCVLCYLFCNMHLESWRLSFVEWILH